ncbi:sensor domain-containing diguanylate cyclase [Calothrix sp. NIES-2098]|uniref:sensor domain-containing diguanylate cyclase n=1 Tax=Calothrix sp. NIES-2098 TaxID=1954171 RepID=UPI000B60D693|nr:response regulator receiver modulated diguanylate cyclase/phosphodiesterase with PAS/PAC sensor(s) [Calothrix sp. NIES-2098]
MKTRNTSYQTDIFNLHKSKINTEYTPDNLIKVIDYFPDLILISTLGSGYCVEINQTFLKVTGYSRENVIGYPITVLDMGFTLEGYLQIQKNLETQEHIQNLELEFCVKTGEKRTGLLSAKLLQWQRKTYLLNIIRDITDRKQVEEELRRIAMHDPLTGLPNRAYFMQQLNYVLECKQYYVNYFSSILFLDLDGFKAINDNFGHEAGDKFLIEVSQRLKYILRWGDFIARLGGDEFVILLDDIKDFRCAARIANQVIAALKQPFVLNGQHISCSVSIGISIIAADDKSPEEVLRKADTAMYQAKAFGKSRYHIS